MILSLKLKLNLIDIFRKNILFLRSKSTRMDVINHFIYNFHFLPTVLNCIDQIQKFLETYLL